MNHIHPKKLLHSKWTARQPQNKEKHFMVVRLIDVEAADAKLPPSAAPGTPALAWVDLEAVHSGQSRRIAWRELKDDSQWRQGWL
jgi:hypothetical protein